MKFKIFLIVFILSLPLLWGISIFQKNLEDFLFWQEMANNQKVLSALAKQETLEQELRELKPIRNHQIDNLQLEAKSAISVLINPVIDSERNEKILFKKEIDKK
jgi:hypothetical protein